MRLVQRHGRVDRIGSPHKSVFLRTFFPSKQLDLLLKLEERVRRKLAQAAASVGVEDAPIVGGRSGDQSFSETRDEIERLSKGDASIFEAGGTAGAAQTGEEYRQELRKALERHGDRIVNLPWRIGSIRVRAERTGHFFCASVDERLYPRVGPLYREVEALLREHPPADITPERYTRALDTLLAPWPKREERVLREAWENEFDNLRERATMLIGAIERVGAMPFHAPEPLPPISVDEIHLVAWMGLRKME